MSGEFDGIREKGNANGRTATLYKGGDEQVRFVGLSW